MTRPIAWLGLVLALAGPLGGAPGQAPAGRNRFEQRWAFAADGSVRIVNPSGRIRVIGWDSDSLAAWARGPGHFAADGNAGVRKLVVTGRAELEVHVPRGARVWVKSTSADIDVVGVDGTLDLNSVAGAGHVGGAAADGWAGTRGGPGGGAARAGRGPGGGGRGARPL